MTRTGSSGQIGGSSAYLQEKEIELTHLEAEKGRLEEQRRALKHNLNSASTMEERIQFLTMVVKSLKQCIDDYNSTKNTRLVEAVAVFREQINSTAELFQTKDQNVSGKAQQLISAASKFLTSTIELTTLTSHLPLSKQLSRPAEVQDKIRVAAEHLLGVATVLQDFVVAWKAAEQRFVAEERTRAISLAIRETGLHLEQVVRLMSLPDHEFNATLFGETVSKIGLAVKNGVLPLLSNPELTNRVIQALTELLQQARTYKDQRTIIGRTLVTTALTTLLDCLMSLSQQ